MLNSRGQIVVASLAVVEKTGAELVSSVIA